MTNLEPVVDVATILTIEQHLVKQGTPLYDLMYKAGCTLAECAQKYSDTRLFTSNTQQSTPNTQPFTPVMCTVSVLCGNGNNGGDGWISGLKLAEAGFDVHILTLHAPEAIQAQPARDMAAHCIACAQGLTYTVHVAPTIDEVDTLLSSSKIIIDALLGTGFTGKNVREPFDAWINSSNTYASCGAYVIAADVPSGMNAQSGGVSRPCIKADTTITMIAAKPGLVTPYAFAFAGDVSVARIADISEILTELLATNDITADNSQSAYPRASFACNDTTSDLGSKSTTGTTARTRKASATSVTKTKSASHTTSNRTQSAFLRAENEDDDGYDPYSDRHPEPEPFFDRDPWN